MKIITPFRKHFVVLLTVAALAGLPARATAQENRAQKPANQPAQSAAKAQPGETCCAGCSPGARTAGSSSGGSPSGSRCPMMGAAKPMSGTKGNFSSTCPFMKEAAGTNNASRGMRPVPSRR